MLRPTLQQLRNSNKTLGRLYKRLLKPDNILIGLQLINIYKIKGHAIDDNDSANLKHNR